MELKFHHTLRDWRWIMSNEARELIIALRGGVPPKCDFCNKEIPPEHLHPEEAGDWACIDCITRWEKQERATGGRP